MNLWGWDDKWIVRSGDTLYRIATVTGTTTQDLMKANCLVSSTIYPGQALWVPSLPVTPSRTPTVPAPEIISFTLDPASEVVLGESVQVDWEVEGDVDSIRLYAGTETLVSDGEKTGSFLDYPSELGSRSYRLTATGPGGSDSATRSIEVVDELSPPVAAFTASPTSGEAPLTVSFTNESTGEIGSWSWTFGDGGTSSDKSPSPYTYDDAGTFTVSLTVTGPGGSNSASTTISVSEPAPPVPPAPVAAFTASPTSGEAPLTVSFTNESTGEIGSWSWTFGDGGTSSDKSPSPYTYDDAGTFTVSLTVTGPGGSNSASTTIHVTGAVTETSVIRGIVLLPGTTLSLTVTGLP